MSNEILSILMIFLATIIIAVPLGKYLGKVFVHDKTWLDRVFQPLEKLIFKLCGIRVDYEMNWKEHLKILLLINLVAFIIIMLVLTNMSWLPLNPDHNPSMSPHLAFNTSLSFISNTNLQHYSGETGISYLGQIVLMIWQFLSAAEGMAICAIVFLLMRNKTFKKTGNFFDLFVRSLIRILLPLSLILSVLLVFNGVPMTYKGKATITTIQGDTVNVSRGPVAAMVAIKQLGTNGGGFYGTNSAHPLENPNYFTNALECMSIFLIPVAMVFALGYVLKRRRLSWMIFGVMTVGFILLLIPTMNLEMHGNPALVKAGVISQPLGNMEGKEVRFGPVASSFWSVITTCTSSGSVNSMHDSLTPLAGMNTLLGMMTNCFYGGVGCGFLNFYIFIILAVFISGLMVGRTPEFLGRKIEAREMKIAMLVALLHPFLILTSTAIASHLSASHLAGSESWLNNPGFHGFTAMLYEFTSSSANNGSNFAGLGNNVPFWNILTGIVILFARFVPIIGTVAIAGSLATKKVIPESAGTLKTDTMTFGIMVFAVIVIVAALAFFPALSLGPIAEYFM